MSELTPEQIEAVFSALPGIYFTEQSENVYLARAIIGADRAQRQAGQEAVAFSQFLSDVMTAAGLVEHGKQCKALGQRLADGCATFRTMLYTTPPAAPVPEGFKLVPLEPTEAMRDAAAAPDSSV